MDHLALLGSVTGRFERELRAADPAAQLASVRWSVHDLGAHLGGVHDWVTANLTTSTRNARVNVPQLSVPVDEWYSRARSELMAKFAATPASDPVWTMSRTDRTVAFWHRRQLHESLVHLWDLRSATTLAPPTDDAPEVYADAVDELFDTFLPRSTDDDRASLTGSIELRATDLDRSWAFGPGFQPLDGTPDAVVSAPAGALMLLAWNRIRADRDAVDAVTVTGSAEVVAQFHRAHVRP